MIRIHSRSSSIHRSASALAAAALVSALGAVAGCSAPVDAGAAGEPAAATEHAESATSALTPTQKNWKTLAINAPVPFDAVALGRDTDGSTLYSCRALYQGGIHPGKTRQSFNGKCNIAWGGAEVPLQGGQALVPAWTFTSNGNVPLNAVALGHEADGTPLYVCRGFTGKSNSQVVGKLHQGFTGCFLPYAGHEIPATSYDVLVLDDAPGRMAYQAVQTSPGVLPIASLVGGYDDDGAPLYMCLGAYAGGLIPGKTRADWNKCSVSYGNSEQFTNDYQVVTAKFQSGPTSAEFVGGYESDGTTPLGVCFQSYLGSLQVGKYVGWGACDFGYAGHEETPPGPYSVLTQY